MHDHATTEEKRSLVGLLRLLYSFQRHVATPSAVPQPARGDGGEMVLQLGGRLRCWLKFTL